MLVLELFEGDFYVFSELALLALIDEKDLFDFLFVEIECHDVVLFEIFDLSLFVDEFALLILEFFLADDPIIVDSLSFLLEVG